MLPGGLYMKKQTLKSEERERVVGTGERLTIETTADFAQRIRKESGRGNHCGY